jgi:hypothetical protein
MQHALDDDLAFPEAPQCAHIVPIEPVFQAHARIIHRAGDGRASIRGVVAIGGHAAPADIWRQHAQHPARVHGDIQRRPRRPAERHAEAVMRVVFPIGGDDRVGGDDQRCNAAGTHPFQQAAHQRAILPDIQLEPQFGAGRPGANILKYSDGLGGNGERDAAPRRCPRQLDLAIMGNQAGERCGRDDERRAHLPAEQRDAEFGFAVPGQDARRQTHGRQILRDGQQRRFVFAAAVDVFEHPARQTATRGQPEIMPVQQPRHVRRPFRWS